MDCKNCGSNLRDKDGFCSNCGARVIEERITLKFIFKEILENFKKLSNEKTILISHRYINNCSTVLNLLLIIL